jgi:hypothetical protein
MNCQHLVIYLGFLYIINISLKINSLFAVDDYTIWETLIAKSAIKLKIKVWPMENIIFTSMTVGS